MSETKKYITLGLGHAMNDCIAGFIIGSLFYHGYSIMEMGIYTLAYNLLAFGGQLVVARVIELHFFPKKYLAGCFVLLPAALLLLNVIPPLAVLLSGIASAVFHVTGGVEATRKDDKAFGIGIFASPGIVGLIGGGIFAYMHIDIVWPGVLLCALYAFFIWRFYRSSPGPVASRAEPEFEKHDIVMVILVTVISLRSVIWDVVQLVQQQNYAWLMIIAVAAMCGKIVGGFLSDRIGYTRYTTYALMLAIPFLTLLKKNIIALSIGVFLLQSTIPSTTVMIIKAVKRKPALAIALSFGVSILVAISLFYTPLVKYLDNNIVIAGIILASLALLMTYRRFTYRS